MLNNLTQVEQHDYSKNIFIGTVVYNDDPLMLKRVKVSIPKLFTDTDPEKLPWVAPMFFGFIANGSGSGGGSAHLVPAIGTELVIEFQMGSPLHGLYIASPIRPDQLPAEFRDSDYLWTYGWKDPAGNIFLVNTKEGNNTIRLLHASGTEIKVINSGKIQIHGVENIEVQIDGDANVTTNGNVNHNVNGDFNITTGGNFNVTTGGVVNLNEG